MIDDRSVSLCRIDRTCGPIHPLLKSRIVTRHHEWINLGNHEIRFCTFKNKKNEKSYTYSVKYIVSMIIEDPKKRKSKKNHPTSSRSRAPGRPSQLARLAPETHSRCPPSPCPLSPRPSPPRSPVVPSAPSARPRPPPRDPSWYVFRFRRSFFSLARAHPEEIASSARAFAIGTSGKRVGRRTPRGVRPPRDGRRAG
jgi:hypothetical protein